MKAAIILSGARQDDLPADLNAFDLVVVVGPSANIAAGQFWVCNEADVFDAVEHLGNPRLVTSADCLQQIVAGPGAERLAQSDEDEERLKTLAIEDLFDQFDRSTGFSLSKTTTAMAVAAAAGATELLLVGQPDRKGLDPASAKCCREVFAEFTAYLAARGVKLIGPPDPTPPARAKAA